MHRRKSMKDSTLFIIRFGIATRMLVFIKGMLTASRIGANYRMDTYVLAFGAIMLLTRIIGDGIIVAIIPLLREIQEKEGTERRMDYTNNLINTTILISSIIIAIGYVAAPIIIKIYGPGFQGVELEETISLFRLGLPIIMLTWIRSIGGGFLQSDHAFRAGAKGGVSNAIVYIVYLYFFAEKFGLKGLIIIGSVAIISQIYIVIKTMNGKGYKYKWKIDLKDKYLPQIILVLLPVLISIGVNEINFAVDNAIASTQSVGSIAELSYANDVMDLFLGLFIAAIVTVTFPILSEYYHKNDMQDLRRGIRHGINLLLVIAIPASVILMTMAGPIIKIFFERGEFDANASFFTSQALAYYAIGLTAMAITPLIVRAYYAINDNKTPIKIGLIALPINIILDLILVRYMGIRGLALGTSISIIIATSYGVADLNRKIKFTEEESMSAQIIKLAIAAVVMVSTIMIAYGGLATTLNNNLINNMILVGVSGSLAVGMYVGICKLLKVQI